VRLLATAAVADDAAGREVDDEVGELVLTRPLPSMPVAFWNVIDAVPRTLTGKKLEVPVKRILVGVAPDAAVSRDAVLDPDALAPFVDLARVATR
jgi:acetoacetyl-CoA synthetase